VSLVVRALGAAAIAFSVATARALDPAADACIASDDEALRPSVANPYHPHADLRSAEFHAANAEYLAAVARIPPIPLTGLRSSSMWLDGKR